jgi:hypothetical protein
MLDRNATYCQNGLLVSADVSMPTAEKLLDSQFDFVARRCLSLCRDAEAMRIAVVIGKEKLGLPVVSMLEF